MTDTTPPGGDAPVSSSIPKPATTGALAVVGLDLQEGKKIPRGWVVAWAAWDWGGAAFNAVITTFVFTVYLTGTQFIAPKLAHAANLEKNLNGPAHKAAEVATSALSSELAWAIGIAGIVVALIAPVLGQRSDGSGRRKFWLGVNTFVVVVITAAMFFVVGAPQFFLLGVALIAVGTVFYEIATVNYYAMLIQVSTPKTVGRVSGIGWASGYLGGIVLLLLVYFGLAVGGSYPSPVAGLLNVPTADGLNYRIIALVAAVWTLVFALPVLFTVPEIEAVNRGPRVSFLQSYRVLFRDIAALWRSDRNTVQFLISSALFRDGLVGVFTFGGILAAGTFHFTFSEVLIFGAAANIVAGVSTLISGLFDERFGPKPVIVVSLIGVIAASLGVFFLHDLGTTAFWVLGLILAIFVGPAQSASRTFLARVAPAGKEGETFGLYATTGRAVSFLAPTLFALFIAIAGPQYWGILGIVIVLVAGLAFLIPVKQRVR
jgi:UMF1 family MFS transporter